MAQEKNFSDEQNLPQAEFQQNFNSEDLDAAKIKPSSQKSSPNRERIKHLLIGSPKAVTSTIHFLQMIGYANVGDWSPLQPIGDSDEVMSILIRQISVS
ncbi:hypothetical protein I8748_11250 [Nostoc sp. CENA67]|uniref:Uncharacterized protein n=1 Tax=Amazonocrinis nigriterrae CENA67 TaxID=2794033 RepID=A0A8J7HUF7_9NOST|nr:hypothetical protein [Amazonocrinis nigriterrae]MBH8562749.1 hypothetical protein [Amazonocrinis nigriterrae CENA67]